MDATMREARILGVKIATILIVMALLACAATGWGIKSLMNEITPSKVKWWATLATVALPFFALIGFLFGRREANVMADGLRAGVNEVTRAADEVTTLKDKAAARSRQPPVTVQVAAGALPPPQVYHRQIEGGETVDL